MDSNSGLVFETTEEQMRRLRSLYGEDTHRFVDLPHKPLPECRRCGGRGSVRVWMAEKPFAPCPECYPEMQKTKLPTFKDRIAALMKS